MIGLLERLRQRKESLQALKDNSPEAHAARLVTSFERTLSAFGSVQERIAQEQRDEEERQTLEENQHRAKEDQDKKLDRAHEQQKEGVARSQLDTAKVAVSTSELNTRKISGVLGDVILELRRGFKNLENTVRGSSTGIADDLLNLIPGGKGKKGVLKELEKDGARALEHEVARPSVLGRVKDLGSKVWTNLEEQDGLVSNTAKAGKKVMGSINTMAKPIVGMLGSGLQAATTTLGNLKTSAVEGGSKVLGTVGELGYRALAPVTQLGPKALGTVKALGSSALEGGSRVLGTVKSLGSAAIEGGSKLLDSAKSMVGLGESPVRAVPRMGGLLAAGMSGYDEYKLLSDDKKTGREKAVGTAGIAGGAAGGVAGAELGAAIGTAVLPVVGTAIGGVIGGIGGYMAGSGIAESAGNMVADAVHDSGLGDVFARASTSVMDVFTRDVAPAFQTVFGPVIGAISSFGSTVMDGAKKWFDQTKNNFANFEESAKQLGGGVAGAAGAIWGSVRHAAGQIAQGNLRGAGQALRSGAGQAYGELKGGYTASQGLSQGRYDDLETQSIAALSAKGEKFRGGKGLTQDSKTMIDDVSKKYGVDSQTMKTMAQIESGGNANAVSATGAAGMYQFTGGTAQQYGIKNRFDARENTEAAAKMMKDNAAYLKSKGLEPTAENLYLAHQQGAGGAAQILNAAQGKGTVSAEVQKAMGQNYGNMSAADYVQKNKEKVAAAAKASQETYAGTYNSGTQSVALGAAPTTSPSIMGPEIAKSKHAPEVAQSNKQAKVAGAAHVSGVAGAAPVSGVAGAAKVATVSGAVSGVAGSTMPSVAAVGAPLAGAVLTRATSPEPAIPMRVAEARVAPIPQLNPSTPVETTPVTVTNQPKPVTQPKAAVAAKAWSSGSGVPELSEIPPFFPDLALASMMLGRV